MDYTHLDSLMEISKKSDAPKEKKRVYFENMFALFSEEGYSDNAEMYFFKGFSFNGAFPVFEFMKKLDDNDKNNFITNILKGEKYNENENGTSLKILIHLLGLFIVHSPDDIKIIDLLLHRIPYMAKTKANKITKDLPSILEKYFISEITQDTVFPEYKKLVNDNDFGKDFSFLFLSGLKEIKAKNNDVHKIMKINNWLDAKLTVDSDCSALKSKNESLVRQNKQQSEEEVGIGTLNRIKEQLQNNISTLSKFVFFISDLQNELSFAKRDKKKFESECLRLKTENEAIFSEKSKLINECFSLRNDNTSKGEIIIQLKGEIEKQKSILSIYSTDKQNSLSEQLNVLASKLKTHYLNYKDSLEMEMTVELGEKLKNLMGEIFKTLAKSGADVDKKV